MKVPGCQDSIQNYSMLELAPALLHGSLCHPFCISFPPLQSYVLLSLHSTSVFPLRAEIFQVKSSTAILVVSSMSHTEHHYALSYGPSPPHSYLHRHWLPESSVPDEAALFVAQTSRGILLPSAEHGRELFSTSSPARCIDNQASKSAPASLACLLSLVSQARTCGNQ